MAIRTCTLDQQIAICREIAGLARAKLPVQPAFESLSKQSEHPLAKFAGEIQRSLASGLPLAQAIAPGCDLRSQQLAAVIRAGERAGMLGQAIDAWSLMVLANLSSAKRLRTSLLYPILLILVAAISLAFTIWHLVPEYEHSFLAFDMRRPDWFFILLWIRNGLWWESIVFLAVVFLPLVVWFWRRSTLHCDGWPNDPSQRTQLHALSADIAAMLVEAQVPAHEIESFTTALAVPNSSVLSQVVKTNVQVPGSRENRNILGREISSLLAIVEAKVSTPPEISRQLRELAHFLRYQAQAISLRQAHFVPMLVSMVVGSAVVLTYVGVIYLPWLNLLSRIVLPEVAK